MNSKKTKNDVKSLVKELTVAKHCRYFHFNEKGFMNSASSKAGDKVSLDIYSKAFEGQKIKFVEFLNGTVDKWKKVDVKKPKANEEKVSEEKKSEKKTQDKKINKTKSRYEEVVASLEAKGFDVDPTSTLEELENCLLQLED